jgi:hypothetical protein
LGYASYDLLAKGEKSVMREPETGPSKEALSPEKLSLSSTTAYKTRVRDAAAGALL